MLNVEQAIREVGTLYQSLTGRPIQAGRTELPPEADPMTHVEGRYRQLRSLLDAQNAVPGAQTWAPPVEVVELEREVRCEMDLPGVPRESVTITVTGDYVVVRGERPNGRAQESAIRYTERPHGTFQRAIALPPRARRDGIEAAFRDGVLQIMIPTDGSGASTAEVPVPIK